MSGVLDASATRYGAETPPIHNSYPRSRRANLVKNTLTRSSPCRSHRLGMPKALLWAGFLLTFAFVIRDIVPGAEAAILVAIAAGASLFVQSSANR